MRIKNAAVNRRCAAAWAARNPVAVILKRAKHRATRAGIPFDLSAADVVIGQLCPVLGIPLVRGTGTSVDGSPTIDRRVPELGYVPGNVTVISNKANRIKNDATLEELKRVVLWLDVDTSRGRV